MGAGLGSCRRRGALGRKPPTSPLDDGNQAANRHMIEAEEMGFDRFGDRLAVILDNRRNSRGSLFNAAYPRTASNIVAPVALVPFGHGMRYFAGSELIRSSSFGIA